jgi:hypothetical protein
MARVRGVTWARTASARTVKSSSGLVGTITGVPPAIITMSG